MCYFCFLFNTFKYYEFLSNIFRQHNFSFCSHLLFLCVCVFWCWLYFRLAFQFLCLLPPLYELILEIERDDIRGGQLLNLLHKRCHCGVPELQTCMQRYAVLFTCSILGNVKMQVVSFPTMWWYASNAVVLG